MLISCRRTRSRRMRTAASDYMHVPSVQYLCLQMPGLRPSTRLPQLRRSAELRYVRLVGQYPHKLHC